MIGRSLLTVVLDDEPRCEDTSKPGEAPVLEMSTTSTVLTLMGPNWPVVTEMDVFAAVRLLDAVRTYTEAVERRFAEQTRPQENTGHDPWAPQAVICDACAR